MTTPIESLETDAAPAPPGAPLVVSELESLAGELGGTLRCSGVRGFDDDGLL
ncbi:MAG: hypothetical protein H7311_14935, partial [Ramlibacter sp.]|nr:hypothetical protein [Cryobacterium sp.]